MSHQEKQEIFDQYAESVGYSSWAILFNSYVQNSHYLQNHIFEACDLVQEEQQKRIAENAKTKVERKGLQSKQIRYGAGSWTEYSVDKNSIINPENKIQ